MDNLINKLKSVDLSRPEYLSALGHYNTPKYLDYLIDKEDRDLNGVDYSTLLNTNELAGTFNETIYYLPLATIYLCKDIEDRLEMIQDFVYYIFINKENIESLFNIKIQDILNYVIDCNMENHLHFYGKNDGLKATSCVKNLWFLEEIFKMINRFEVGKEWIDNKIEEMKIGNEIQKKWLYTLYEECNEVFGLYLDDEVMLEVLDTIPNFD